MNPSPSALESTTAPERNTAFRLYQGGMGALVLLTGFFLWQSGGDITPTFVLGLAVLYLSCVPALLWARNNRPWFPAFEINLLTCVAFYAVPMLNRHSELANFPDAVVAESAAMLILYLVAANGVFLSARKPVRSPKWATVSLLPETVLRYLPLGLALNAAYLYVDIFTRTIPYDMAGLFRALFFGVGIICTFVLSRMWGLGILTQNSRIFFILMLLLQIVFLLTQLYLVRAISLLTLALIAYSSARRRVPWLILLIVLPTLAFLHRGKSEMRRIYWEESKPLPELSGIPGFFSEWVDYSLESKDDNEADDARRHSLFERASLIQMLCLSVDRVPRHEPYLYGESYIDIPALVIPRFLWPNKPSSLLSNIRLARHFGLVSEEDAFKVSIAFGMIAESYINFGFLGPPLLGMLIGFLFKRATLLAEHAPQFSAMGIVMILLAAWSFQVEFVMATWLSSIFQAAAVCIGLPLLYRRFTTA